MKGWDLTGSYLIGLLLSSLRSKVLNSLHNPALEID
jgi:hypothetical protein